MAARISLFFGRLMEGGSSAGNYGGSKRRAAMVEFAPAVKAGMPAASQISEPVDILPF